MQLFCYKRDKHIITMYGWMRTYLMGRFVTVREKLDGYKGEIMSKPLRRLDKEIEKKCKLYYNICTEINISSYMCIIYR